jgi:hypothetical protein
MTMRGSLEISISETIHGDYVASCGALSAEGSTPAEAEKLLMDLMESRASDGGRSFGRASVYEDPDLRPIDDEP